MQELTNNLEIKNLQNKKSPENFHLQYYVEMKAFELHHEETNILHMGKQRCRSDLQFDQRLCFRYTVTTISLLSGSKISSI